MRCKLHLSVANLLMVTVAALSGIFSSLNAQSAGMPDGRPFVWRWSLATKKDPAAGPSVDFPLGTATPSEFCGECHGTVYLEHALGFGADLKFKPIVYKSADETPLTLPPEFSDSATAHHVAGKDPWPIRAREVENQGRSCNVCHFPQAFEIPDMDAPMIAQPLPRALEAGGVTCASCHLTPEGKIRGSYDVIAPHQNVVEPRLRTSAMCAYCHAFGKRVIGKQTQTFYEWREDFYRAGLGQQQCQDCHMPRTVRSLAQGYDVSARTVGRHLWTGDHSTKRVGSGLSLTIVQVRENPPQAEFNVVQIEFHVINVGTGHSVPTGSNRRAVYLKAEVLDGNGNVIASKEWMFAPWYGDRPDDRAFLEDDKTRPDAVAAMQADAQGPHEAPLRAGEARILSWNPALPQGNYMVRASLIYDLNRYNDRAFTSDQTQIEETVHSITVP